MKLISRILSVFCAAAMMLGATACGGDSSSQTAEQSSSQADQTSVADESSAAAETTTTNGSNWEMADPSLNLPALNLGYTTPEMCQRAVLNAGNPARLANVMKKAQNKETVTIGCIGGSITQGTGASNSNSNYAFYSMSWWAKAFPENPKLNFVNAGIGATGSYIGVHRAAEDLLAQKPDVVIVEFSVNDTDATPNLDTYDSLVRQIMQADNNPAVSLMFMVQENGTTLLETHKQIGEAYDLPMISFREAVMPEIEKGTFTWQDIEADNIHPNSNGHGIVGELLWNYYNSVYAKLDTIDTSDLAFTAEPVTADRYQNAVIAGSATLTPTANTGFEPAELNQYFPGNWQATEAGATITFAVNARNIGVLYQRTIDGKSGEYEVYVDGELTETLDGNLPDGWGNYAEATEVFTADTAAEHTVELRCKDGNTANEFQLLGLLLSE